MSALEVQNVQFAYKQIKALENVSLTVEPGSFVGLLGANGAGKTTLFSIITGLYRPHSGTVSVMNKSLEQDTLSAMASMGVVFQKSTLDMDLTVTQNLRYAADLHGLSRKDSKHKIAEAIEFHTMQEYAGRKVGALSGGQRRRVELARSLLHNPSLLLLDEPTVGLDLTSRTEFVRHVKSLCQTHNTGVLWATHLVDEVDNSEDIVLLDKGSVIAQGVTGELLGKYQVKDIAQLMQLKTTNEAAAQQ